MRHLSEKKLVIQAKKYKGDSVVISTRLPLELVQSIDQIAEKTGKTRNELVLLCLEFAVNNLVIESGEEE